MIKVWFQTARPHTWIASIAPVFLASIFAIDLDVFSMLPAILCLAFALFMQIATDFSNDYFDFQRGADTAGQKIPSSTLATGIISLQSMRIAIVVLYVLALVFDLLLYPYVGVGVLWVMGACLIGGLLYTATPLAFSYNGLSDGVTILFYGFVATLGTFYVLSGTIIFEVILIGLALGLLTNNICLINHIRDKHTDALVNKKTLIVRFGKNFGCKLFRLETTIALLIPVALAARSNNLWLLLPLILTPWSFLLYYNLNKHTKTPQRYTYFQSKTSIFLLMYTLLLATGFAVPSVISFFFCCL